MLFGISVLDITLAITGGDTVGFITNQWLKVDVERNRKHLPVSVAFALRLTSDKWVMRNEVKATIDATRRGGEFQSVYFTEKDLNAIIPALATGADMNTRRKVALDTLSTFNDQDLVVFLSDLFRCRAGVNRA
ncbi:MAG: hypothetical protein WC830_09140 [Burkholderiales bacterium]